MRWTAAERRWRDALCAALIPPGRALPGIAAVDTAPFWAEWERAAPPLLRFGARVAVWALTFAPLVVVGAPRLFPRLPRAAQERVLARAASSPSYLVRQLVVTLKLLACFAYLRDPSVRAALERAP